MPDPILIKCPECDGRGYVRQIAADWNDWTDWKTCDRCGGWSEVEADPLEDELVDGAGI